jgi:hypothetical protein
MTTRKSVQIVNIQSNSERTGINIKGEEIVFFCDATRIANQLLELGVPVNNRFFQEMLLKADEIGIYPTLEYEDRKLNLKGSTYEKRDGSIGTRDSDNLEFTKFSVIIPLRLLGATRKEFIDSGFDLGMLNTLVTVKDVADNKVRIKDAVAAKKDALAALKAAMQSSPNDKVGEKV